MATSQVFKDYIVRLNRGETVYSEGDPGTEMYIVQSGSVEIIKETGDAKVSLAVMEKGDFFGEMALIESEPHSSSAVAREDCELIEINSTLFDKMIRGNIEIAVRMLRKLSLRLRDATRRLEELAVSSAGPAPVSPPGSASSPSTATDAEPSTISLGTSGPPAGTGSEPPPPAGAVPERDRPANCHAVFLSEEGEELFQLVGPKAVIGRFDPVTGLKPEVDLSSVDLNRSVSRHHARLLREGDAYTLTEEVGALNGTFVNGKQLVSGKPSPIRDGDVVNLGMVKLVFREVKP